MACQRFVLTLMDGRHPDKGKGLTWRCREPIVAGMETIELSQVRELAVNGSARTIRTTARLTLAEVAAEIGVAPSTVWRWERGQRNPRGAAALRYGRLLAQLAGPEGSR